jgi:Spy/CpxP family protein refolding chaperone
MNNPKYPTLIVALLTAGLTASAALAQTAAPPEDPVTAPTVPGNWSGPCPRGMGDGRGRWNNGGDPVAGQLDRMTWRLNLTADQKARLEPILRKRDELRNAQRQAMREEVAAILTPEQITQFERMGPSRGGRMGGFGPGPGSAPVPAPVTQP